MTNVRAMGILNRPRRLLHIRRMRLILMLCLFELLAPILVLLNYLDISLLQLVNINQLFIFSSIIALTCRLPKQVLPFIIVLLFSIIVSIFKMFSLAGDGVFNFTASAVGPYYYSLLLPFMIFISIFSQKEDDIRVIQRDLHWFSKWYLILFVIIVPIYAVLHFTGRISYFGFGLNAHYFAPFFFKRYFYVAGISLLILLTGKRSVLINVMIQFAFYFVGRIKRFPVRSFLFFLVVAVGITLASGLLLTLFRRFILMAEAFSNADLSGGLLGISGSYEAIVLFGGRLEEIVGVVQYFSDHPWQIWLGSPPGANFIWTVEQSDYTTVKSFTHLTWLGYIFRYGIFPTGILVSTLVYYAVRYKDTQNPLWLVFVGTLTSATFGANLFYSPVAWTMIALFLKFGPAISKQIQKENRLN